MTDTPQRLQQPEELANQIIKAFHKSSAHKRLMVAVAGAPASGKSTLAEWLAELINDQLQAQADEAPAIVVPMDGFHLDNAILASRGWQAVKGAPHTFDVSGLQALLTRLCDTPAGPSEPSEPSEPGSGEPLYIPVFDRSMDLARCAASAVEAHHKIILVEGNYLLLDRPGWGDLARYFDLSVMLEVPLDILKTRLIERWVSHGMAADAARQRALSNDIPNAIVVSEESKQAHFVLVSVRQ